ncbi:hypothetical protein VTN02DRAFT_5513 [Thermoascus thermophilus]
MTSEEKASGFPINKKNMATTFVAADVVFLIGGVHLLLLVRSLISSASPAALVDPVLVVITLALSRSGRHRPTRPPPPAEGPRLHGRRVCDPLPARRGSSGVVRRHTGDEGDSPLAWGPVDPAGAETLLHTTSRVAAQNSPSMRGI